MSSTSRGNRGRHSVTKLVKSQSNDRFLHQFADELLEGMMQEQKFIPVEFVYDDLGSELFDRMVDSKEYYLPHKEKEILHEFGLCSVADQFVRLERLGLTVALRAGETVCTGYQRKFSIEGMQLRFAKAGFANVATFTDAQGWYAMTLFQALVRSP